MNRVLITGGAGFIGSHLVDRLMSDSFNITILDNLSTGNLANVRKWLGDPRFEFQHRDLLNLDDTTNVAKGCEMVFHLAANPEVRLGTLSPRIHLEQNVFATFNLLEAIRRGDAKILLFASSSTVYGDALKVPTSESYAPLLPISVYGASKLSCEALITGYAHTYGFRTIIYRLANIIGSRSTHGVVYDFIQKLRENPTELEVLGDGTQTKSYLFISDCIRAMMMAYEKAESHVEMLNIGSEDQVSVKRIAEIVVEEMGLRNVKRRFVGVNEGRGWVGDVRNMLLDTAKLRSRGWNPRHNSEQSVRLTVQEILRE